MWDVGWVSQEARREYERREAAQLLRLYSQEPPTFQCEMTDFSGFTRCRNEAEVHVGDDVYVCRRCSRLPVFRRREKEEISVHSYVLEKDYHIPELDWRDGETGRVR